MVFADPDDATLSTEPDLGISGLTISVEQRLALPGVQVHAPDHACEYQVEELSCAA
jgi:hypothetical protein